VNKAFLREHWDNTFDKARRGAEYEMDTSAKINQVTEKQAFEDDYSIDED